MVGRRRGEQTVVVTTRVRAMAAGVVSAAVALGVAELVAVFTGPRTSPLIAVGGAVVDATPEAVKHVAIQLFGTNDKVALLTGTVLLLAAFAAVVGLLARRDFRWGVAGIGLFALLGVAAAVTRPNAGPLALLPTVVGSAAAIAVLHWLLRAAEVTGADPSDDAARRRFLRFALLGAGGAVVAGFLGRTLSARRGVQEARAQLTLPTPQNPAPALPANVDPPAAGLSPYVTSNEAFYRIDTALVVPQVDPDSWRLRIHGRVARPMELTLQQLMARPTVERYVTLTCVSNEVGGDLVGNARWLGVRVKDLLDEAGPLDGADQVVSRSADGWTCGTPTSALRDGRDALLVFAMNGEPLPVEHGFPVRMVVPGLYGYVSACKWITEMELSSFADFDAYWVRKGWAAQGPIKTESRIDTPKAFGAVSPGDTVIGGVAWAQHRGVSVVEVRVDEGPWEPATLAGTVGPDTWRQWTIPWKATPGTHTISVRAADATGALQPEDRADPFPDGAQGWHTISVQVH
ncbi:molybdopterin-dependent oxidoreductase [Catellatospora sp. TT07R-123]|uniref:molybdopterin-dependent oxidoreductase n=1 Tax=Catellatospora sp. TT07R-123 TaxID=2733863 RepID=UPI0035B545A8